MKKYFINNNSRKLILFFTGWGCDEHEFSHLESNTDVLILYDYTDLKISFDFSNYDEINLISFSAGVFIASIINFDFKINNKFAISGNPYLFDDKLGLSKKTQDLLYNITEETAEEFAKNYLVKTDEEWNSFRPSNRTLDSCKFEFNFLKSLYEKQKKDICDNFDVAIFGQEDPLFDVTEQKKFYNDRLRIVKNARHNIFFRIHNYEQIFELGEL